LGQIDHVLQFGEDEEVKDPMRRFEDLELPDGMVEQ